MSLKYRKYIRLPEFDYSQPRYYFVTICTHWRRKILAPFIDPKYGHKIADYAVEGLVPANKATTRVATTHNVANRATTSANRATTRVATTNNVDNKVTHNVVARLVRAQEKARKATMIIVETLTALPKRFHNHINNDFYIIMSDHLHWILAINESTCTTCPCPIGDHKGRHYNLGNIVGAFKSLITRRMWQLGYKGRLFQPNYYEHIVRTESALEKIRQYIFANPYIEYEGIPWQRLDPDM